MYAASDISQWHIGCWGCCIEWETLCLLNLCINDEEEDDDDDDDDNNNNNSTGIVVEKPLSCLKNSRLLKNLKVHCRVQNCYYYYYYYYYYSSCCYYTTTTTTAAAATTTTILLLLLVLLLLLLLLLVLLLLPNRSVNLTSYLTQEVLEGRRDKRQDDSEHVVGTTDACLNSVFQNGFSGTLEFREKLLKAWAFCMLS